jgi:hypothetical protein
MNDMMVHRKLRHAGQEKSTHSCMIHWCLHEHGGDLLLVCRLTIDCVTLAIIGWYAMKPPCKYNKSCTFVQFFTGRTNTQDQSSARLLSVYATTDTRMGHRRRDSGSLRHCNSQTLYYRRIVIYAFKRSTCNDFGRRDRFNL